MNILEIIELRIPEEKKIIVEEYLSTWMDQAMCKKKTGTIVVNYRHLHLSTDFSVHLQSEGKENVRELSSLSKQLILSLKNFGLVNYSIWVEHNRTR